MAENQFSQLYKTWKTEDLLQMLKNPQNYQFLAVEAAQEEINSRNLTSDQLRNANEILQRQEIEKILRDEKFNTVLNLAKGIFSTTVNTFEITPNMALGLEKYIRVVTFSFLIMFLHEVFNQWSFLRFMFSPLGKWDIGMLVYFVPMVILPIAGILFWLRKKAGWILASFYFISTANGDLAVFLEEMSNNHFSSFRSNYFPLDNSPAVYLVSFLFFGGLSLILDKRAIRTAYNVTNKVRLITMLVAIASVWIFIFALAH